MEQTQAWDNSVVLQHAASLPDSTAIQISTANTSVAVGSFKEEEECGTKPFATDMVTPSTSGKRQSLDGHWYNYQSFVDWYGEATAPRTWAEAIDYDSFLASNPSAYELLRASENGCPTLDTAIEGAAYNSYFERGKSLETESLVAKESFEMAQAVWV